MGGSRGGGGVTGGPDPLKNHKNIGLLSDSGPDRQKNHKARLYCWAIIGMPVKCHLNGVSLAGQ